MSRELSAIVRIWDNGGRTFDRYTIMPPEWATGWRASDGRWQAIASSEDPFHPQGFGQTADAIPGEHLGERIEWDALPADVQRFARQSFPAFCPPPPCFKPTDDALRMAIYDCLPDLERNVRRSGPGPDARLARLLAVLEALDK